MKCVTCSAELREDVRFCSSCGSPVSSFSQMPTGLATPSSVEAVRRRVPFSDPIGRLASPESLDPRGLAPGSVIAARYRIIGLIGRGGMGEVYRADDLKLGQPVALKFLPESLASDPAWIERFYAEVRHARGVSHPNVCRVYDVGEIEGRHFLSMEYVDGEDLASLLRRIGRFPPDKAVQIARELCAGLAAAHDKGVLHRDLKPSNVMIDGRGRARITDFGLAAGVEEDKGGAEVSGTPAYMAPEQLSGKGASVQSDIYALGLVLYEIFTGRKPFEAATLADWRRKHSEDQPTAPSIVTPGLDPAVERVILRCLEKDPKARPRSVAAVAAALPGGDPLAAAIAAGETPSPEMVAAAGSDEGMKPGAAWACLVSILAGLALAAWLSPRAYRHGNVPLEKPPDALVEKSKEIARRLGYTEKPADIAWGFSGNGEYRRWVEEHDQSKDRWKGIESGRPAAIYFWCRQSPAPLISERFRGDDAGEIRVTETDPPPLVAGMVGIELDPLGRLIRFEAVPSSATPTAADRQPDWEALFSEAGLDRAAFAPTEPRWLPPFYADSRMAWSEGKPERADRPLRVEAAAHRGRPVYFELVGPWSRPPRMPPTESRARFNAFDFFVASVFTVLLVGGALLARRNLRLGRGDPRGAMRVAAFIFVCWMLDWALETRHVGNISEYALFTDGLSGALFFAGLSWLIYIALEPLIRRRWPDSLIAWTRLLSGRFTDPLVGRVLLAGALLGVFEAISVEVEQLTRRALEATPPIPPFPWTVTLRGPRAVAGHLVGASAISMLLALAFALLFFLLRAVLRKEWLAAGAFALIMAVPLSGVATERGEAGGLIAAAFGLIKAAAFILVFLRFGLLALVFGNFFGHFLEFPLTTDSSAWYAGTSLFLLLVLAAVAIYGFRIALAGRPMYSGMRLED
ncbi:MAG TPA: serine/threonine-protein kinase [Thermoanaerobaculia bacterium]